MKKMKRMISLALLLCLLISLLPPVQLVSAAKVAYRYVLDTDGLDIGDTYLIVDTKTAGNANVLSRNNTSILNQNLTVQTDGDITYIDAGFSMLENCHFVFSGNVNSAKASCGGYYLNLKNNNFNKSSNTNGSTLACGMVTSNANYGAYRIYFRTGPRYLRFDGNAWTTINNASDASTELSLYKLTEYEAEEPEISYTVTYDGNGHQSGEVPGTEEVKNISEPYTIATPTNLRKVDENGNVWLFDCWNTAPNGSGDNYPAGSQVVLEGDLELFAKWRPEISYTVSMITYLDDVATDVNKFAGYNRLFYAVLEGGDGTYIPLTRSAEGTYSAKVTENGTYIIHAITADGKYEPVHGHKVIIYNQDGSTECMHYSITYDAAGGTWAEGEEPGVDKCHFGEHVISYDKVPTREGYRFLGWRDQDGKLREPNHMLTEFADRKLVLTAVWEELITVTVNVTLDHNAISGGKDRDINMHEVLVALLYQENGVNLPVAEKLLNAKSAYDSDTHTTTYQVVFENMPQGIYRAISTKTGYETTIHYGGTEMAPVIDIDLKYTPENFDLHFDVIVNAENQAEKSLMPKAVNVKVSYWGYGENNVLGWHIISQQEGNNAPTTVYIDENGRGSGYFPVWSYWPDGVHTYDYRVEVTSFVLPDGTIVPASGDLVTYTTNGSSLYQATVAVVDGRAPAYPDGSNTGLTGAYYNGTSQSGAITVNVDIFPMTVTFDAGDGTVNGQQTIVLENQFRYPPLHDYTAVSNAAGKAFIYWTDENGNPATNMEYQLLTGNVTYYAHYSTEASISGTVTADATYMQDGQTVQIIDVDRVETVMVVLQKKVGYIYNDVSAVKVNLTYEKNDQGQYTVGTGTYTFNSIDNNGTEYRVVALAVNYAETYDNNQDGNFSTDEFVAQVDHDNVNGQVDIHLDFAPESFDELIRVDATRIHQDLRPTGVLAQILYRDLGENHHYQVISQHAVAPYGVMMNLNTVNSVAVGVESVWNRHTNGMPYEYQLQIATVYGNDVAGAYSKEGTDYTLDLPYTIVYGAPNTYLTTEPTLEAVLVPKQYKVILDPNLGDDTTTQVHGLEDYIIDDDSNQDLYAFIHTWSFAEQFTAYPYREGYVFMGWKSPNTDDVYIKDGVIHVGNTLANDITLVAQWEKLSGTDYTIRYLERYTDKVLQGATVISGAVPGTTVKAVEKAVALKGYAYTGALINGAYVDKYSNPEMTISNDPTKNVLVIYYVPDGSDGYTDQMESNLEISKTAVLEDNGTYTITMDTFTKDNPITTRIQQNTPLDIVLVLDQSGSMAPKMGGAMDELRAAVANFIDLVSDHGYANQVDHRIAIVGYAGDNTISGFNQTDIYTTVGIEGNKWCNTGVFDSHGNFQTYSYTGFTYTEWNGVPSSAQGAGPYYTEVNGEYLLLTYHETYHHLLTESEARIEALNNTTIYGFVDNDYVVVKRNSSGLWLYGDKQLYSDDDFYTFHEDVWTHRHGLGRRQIHAYGSLESNNYTMADNHDKKVYTRTVVKANPTTSIYADALVPVTVGANGAGAITPGLLSAAGQIGANGETHVKYGIELANRIFAANPLTGDDGRTRIVVVFTDGMPGKGVVLDEEKANDALAAAYTTTHEHGASIYTIGMYGKDIAVPEIDQELFLKGLSSNYPNATTLEDVWSAVKYIEAESGVSLTVGGPYYAMENDVYYPLARTVDLKTSTLIWYYDTPNGRVNIYTYQSTNNTYVQPVITNGKVGSFTIYRRTGETEKNTVDAGYYTAALSGSQLEQYFAKVMQDITTNVTTEVILDSNTILRDIMNQGMVLTKDTVISAYTQAGTFNTTTGTIDWSKTLNHLVTLDLSTGNTSATDPKSGVRVDAFNLDATNATNPNAPNYHPHTVDVTGYAYKDWYISEDHQEGFKMIVTISRVEAMDDVQWGRSTSTNNAQSGLWLPMDEYGNRQLLMAFDQPNTIFVERAYVLDYGKEFTLSGWYFDDAEGQDATAIHVDCDLTNGMNYFNPETPNTSNQVTGGYGNTKYGNVTVKDDGTVTYAPTTMNWGGYDSFYVFGNTWRKTVLAQDANENGNLWNKVTVIPANNIYYEDSFVTTEGTTQNGIEGFTFTGAWVVEGTDSGNIEIPERYESAPYGDVHGWTDSLGDDLTFTDGSAHVTGLNKEMGAKAEFTFTGTGVEVYSRTNAQSGMVVAVLNRIAQDETGRETSTLYKSLAMDNLAVSGDYYHIPTVAFKDLPYGTYKLQLIATMTTATTNTPRYVYYIDGVRVHNPLGNTTNYQTDTIKNAYGQETNAVFTEVRDILLDYGDFNVDMPDEGKLGAVFIDSIKDGQGTGNDPTGSGVSTYEIGTFEALGPKNEVYLSQGQAIVLKVSESNFYYVGLKSLTGAPVAIHVSGIEQEDPTTITLSHTTDMYYRVTPVDGYIVIQNANEDGAILSITNLRTTNLTAPASDGGILPVTSQEAIDVIDNFATYMLMRPEEPQPSEPEEEMPSVEEQVQATQQQAAALFTSVRQWLGTE